MSQRWVARWIADDGTSQALTFYSAHTRAIARIDFLLKLIDVGRPFPDTYELEEASNGLSGLPGPVRFVGETDERGR